MTCLLKMTIICLTVKVVKPDVFSMVVFLPFQGSRVIGWEAVPAIEFVMRKVNNDSSFRFLHDLGHSFSISIKNIGCVPSEGIYQFVELYSNPPGVNVIIGPYCDEVCTAVGLLAGRYRIPLISYGCKSEELSDRELFPTFLRTLGTFKEMAMFVKQLVNYFGWTRVTLVSGRQDVWLEAVTYFEEVLEDLEYPIRKWLVRESSSADIITKLKFEATKTRVFILCAYGDVVIRFMDGVAKLGLNNGDYAFVAIDYLDMVNKLNLNLTIDRKIFEGLLDVTIDVKPTESRYLELLDYVKKYDDGSHGYTSNYEHSLHAALLADSILVYACAVNATIANNGTPYDGLVLADQLYGRKIQGISGIIDIQSNGNRNTTFSLHNIKNGSYQLVAGSSYDKLLFLPNVSICWPGGGTVPPTGYPKCGWEGSLCTTTETSLNSVTIATSISGVLLLVAIVCFIIIKRKRDEANRIHSMDWKITYTNLQFTQTKQRSSDNSFKSTVLNLSRSSSVRTNGSHDSPKTAVKKHTFISVAILDGALVAIKPVHKPFIAISPPLIREINAVRSLKYKTINSLIGACVEPQKICLIWEYCAKGSLGDVLMNENIKLDWIFKISFMNDIVRGMVFLHNSELQFHGRLKSSNILIDNHWCCKVGDVLMPVFRQGENCPELTEYQENYSKLWTAPEILRGLCDESRKGDVYAFGIIVQEIILSTGPYGNESTDIEEIIEKVKSGGRPPYRPTVSSGLVVEDIMDMMTNCWQEQPLLRPSFVQIAEVLRKVNKGKTTNIIDQMIHMLSKYADHLEELVADRTKQLEEEQKKTDELLGRMLPASIAEDLKRGKTILPAFYETSTVFFSDIVGFTKLAAHSSPFEIVDFLNQLYTTFDNIIDKYDVYKVETIGDAYMVASGLPIKNGINHAGEIATMALAMLGSMSIFTIKHRPTMILQLRTGMHSGPVAAGVVGQKMPRYCLFGDTVNCASRMESSGLALRIHVSPESKELLDQLGGFQLQPRGFVEMKGKGTMFTYFLMGKDGFEIQLPDLTLQAPLSEHNFK